MVDWEIIEGIRIHLFMGDPLETPDPTLPIVIVASIIILPPMPLREGSDSDVLEEKAALL